MSWVFMAVLIIVLAIAFAVFVAAWIGRYEDERTYHSFNDFFDDEEEVDHT